MLPKKSSRSLVRRTASNSKNNNSKRAPSNSSRTKGSEHVRKYERDSEKKRGSADQKKGRGNSGSSGGQSSSFLKNSNIALKKGKMSSSFFSSARQSASEANEKSKSADTSASQVKVLSSTGKEHRKSQEKPEGVVAKAKKKLKDAQDQIALLMAQLEAANQKETSFACQKEIDTLHQILQDEESRAQEEKKKIQNTFQNEIDKRDQMMVGKEEGFQVEKKSFLHSIDILTDSFTRERQRREEERIEHLVHIAALQSKEEWLENALIQLRDKRYLNYSSEESKQEYDRLFKLYGSFLTSSSMTKEEGLIALWEALGKTAGWRDSIHPGQLQLLLSRFSCSQLTFRVYREHHLELGGAVIAEQEVGAFFTVLLSRIDHLAHLVLIDCPVSPIVWDEFPSTLMAEVNVAKTITRSTSELDSKARDNNVMDSVIHRSGTGSTLEDEGEEGSGKDGADDVVYGPLNRTSKQEVLSRPFSSLQSMALWHTKVSAHDLVQLVRLIPSLQCCGFQTIVNGISVHEKYLTLGDLTLDKLMKLCRGKLWVWARLVSDCSDIIV